MFFRACVLDVYLVRKTVGLGSPLSSAGLTTVPLPRCLSRMMEGQIDSEPARLASVLSLPYLASLQTQLDLHLACLGPNPHVDLRTQKETITWFLGPGSLYMILQCFPHVAGGKAALWPQYSHPQLLILIQQAGSEAGECLTSWPLSSNMMSSSARSSWQKSEHFSVTAK